MRLNKSSLFNATIGSAALLCLMSGTALHAANSSAPKNDIKDDRIETTLEGEFWGAKSVDANAIDVTVAGGIVTLTGSVNNLMAKESAVRIAKMIKGVRSVVDRLEVTTAERTDWELERDVITALAQDPATDTWEISVSVINGNVTLNGTVSSYADAIEAAFLFDPRVSSFNPNVAVDAGVVTLTGIVDNLKAKRAAAQNAKNTVGVWRSRSTVSRMSATSCKLTANSTTLATMLTENTRAGFHCLREFCFVALPAPAHSLKTHVAARSFSAARSGLGR